MSIRLLREAPSRNLALLALSAAIVAVFTLSFTGTASAEILTFVNSWGQTEQVDTNDPGAHAMNADSAIHAKAGAITFNITYSDVDNATGFGFDERDSDPTYGTIGAARQASVDRVLAYISSILNESGTCDILITNSVHGTSTGLATGGTYFSGNAPDFVNGHAFKHITTNVDPSISTADIALTFYFDWPSYAGTGDPSYNQYDMDSVLLREITRGLGLISLSNSSGISTVSPYVLSKWDSLLKTGAGVKLFNSANARFQGTTADLIGNGNGVYFTGDYAVQLNGTQPAVYTPSSFATGSSLSFWKDITNSVLSTTLALGDIQREYNPIDIGALKDIGYSNIETPFKFMTVPYSAWIEAGQSVTFSVVAIGTKGDVSYQWYKDDVEIPGATQNSYVIDAAALYHSGNYICIVTDDNGDHESPTAALLVLEVGKLPTTGIVGLAIVAVVCVIAGAFIILRRE
jgi:hypothetical protein